jgi:hypothetical protein
MQPPNLGTEDLAALGASLSATQAFFQGLTGDSRWTLLGDTGFESPSLSVRVRQALVATTRAYAVVP